MDEVQLIAAARAIYERHQDAELARGPLRDMAAWIASGRPPHAEALRAAGLSTVGRDPRTNDSLRLARKAFTRHYRFSIPCAEAVDALVALSMLVEVGAGTGYWSALLRNAGADVVATDAEGPGRNPHGFETGRFLAIETATARDAIDRYPERNIFCSWPTEGQGWAAEAFAGLTAGRRLALISDGRGGITGDASLFDLLEAGFELEAQIEIPQFPRVRDRLTIHRRR